VQTEKTFLTVSCERDLIDRLDEWHGTSGLRARVWHADSLIKDSQPCSNPIHRRPQRSAATVADYNANCLKMVQQARLAGGNNVKALALVQARRRATGGIQASAERVPHNATSAVKAAGAPPEISTLAPSEQDAVRIDQDSGRPRPGSLGRGALGPRPKTLLGLESDDSAPPT
jgi:hypothetical protein